MDKISFSLHHMKQSIILLILRIFFIAFFLNSLSAAALFLFAYTNFQNLYPSIFFPLLYLIHTSRFILEIGLILYLVTRWSTTNFYLTKHQLIRHYGILKNEEYSYELTHIRSVHLDQSILGRLLNYGNLLIILAVSGYHEEVKLHDLAEPKKYERILRKYIEQAIAEAKKN